MKKILTTGFCELVQNNLKLILLIMKRTLLVFVLLFSISAYSYSQVISLNLGKVKLSHAFKEISKKANVDFFYSDSELNVEKIIEVNYTNIDVEELVSKLVGINFNVLKSDNGTILISPTEIQQKIIVEGEVKDGDGNKMPGVAVLIKGTNKGTSTNFDGKFAMEVEDGVILVFKYLGYKTKEVAVDGSAVLNVVLEEDINNLKETIITGIVNRDKRSFTGAVESIKGVELKRVGNINVVQSLRALDPSFLVLENNVMGSNPNVLPKIEVRGQTSITTEGISDEFGSDPNQPLFILDGFETNLTTIVDLDMNRVASITILKDAASTALYGARSANGVVVVETIKPKAGKLRVNYTMDFRVDVPDLSDYNVMNAEEKLEFEVLSGRWTAPSYDLNAQFDLDRQYNQTLAEIRRGVETYWLKQPTQTGTTVGNSLYIDGGSENLTFGIGLNYKTQKGVMKGSDRDTWGANFRLNYRKDKLNISNNLYINGYDSNNSPYGSFSNFVEANPYYRRTDENGNVTTYLDTDPNVPGIDYGEVDGYVVNPLYNATLNSTDNTNNISIVNNLRAIYKISNQFKVQANLQLKKGVTTGEKFLSPEHSDFLGATLFEKGSYTNTRVDNFSYRFNAMASYSKLFNNVHSLNVNVRAEAEETNNERYSTQAVGFPTGTNGNPAFAYSYTPDSSPSTAMAVYRRVNVLGSANYTYKRKYLFDGTYRLDGSTTFGKNEKFSPFWAVGLGWNLNTEFNMDPDKVQMLKIRGNTGSTGNQGFGSVSSTSIYEFNQLVNIFGQGLYLKTLGNPDLKWQRTLNTSVGIDGVFLKNRLSSTINFYNKNTDPLIVSVDLPSSTGVYGYPINTGNLVSKGAEVILRYSPIYNLEKRTVWTVGLTGSFVDTEFDGFANTLNSLNDSQLESRTLQRYKDGYSPDDLWAVPSLGIDPATGKELFLTKDGQQTFEFDADNETVMGSMRPDAEGVISSNLRIKNFSFGMYLRYRIGADKFNYALYNKVENISRQGITLNQDRRALYNRWQNPGDISQFKSISISSTTPISSRFIQEENELIGESINLGYDFSDSNWVESMGLTNLRLKVYMTDIFRVSSIQVERGYEYPFSRSVSFSLNASF